MSSVEFLLVAAILLTAPCVFGGELEDIDKVVDAVGRVGQDPLNPLGSLGEDAEYIPQNTKIYNRAAKPRKKHKAAKAPPPKKVKRADPCDSWKGEADAENVPQDCFVSKQMAKIEHDSKGEYVASVSRKKRLKHKHGDKQGLFELGGEGPAKEAKKATKTEKKKAKAAVKKVKAEAKKKVRAAKQVAKKKVKAKEKAANKAKKQANKKAVSKKNKATKKLKKAKKAAKKRVKKAKNKVKKAKLKLKKVASKSKNAHLRNKKMKKMMSTKSKCNGPMDRKVRSLESALRTCRAGIRRVSEKALQANRKLVSTAKAQGVEFKTEEKKKLSQEGEMLASKEKADLNRAKARTDSQLAALKRKAAKDAKAEGKVRGSRALKMKEEAKVMLKRASKFAKDEKRIRNGEKKMSIQLGRVKKLSAIRKKEVKSVAAKEKMAKAKDKVDKNFIRKKIGKAETGDVKESAAGINAANRKEALKRQQRKLIRGAKNMAMGMNMKNQDIHKLNMRIAAMTNLYMTQVQGHKNQLSNKKANTAKLQACNRDSEEKVGAAEARYAKGIDQLKRKIQLSKEQSQLAKRSLQLCEGVETGAKGRKIKRKGKQEARKIRRAKRAMRKKTAKKDMKKQLKVKEKAKIKKKLKKKEAKKIAKKMKKDKKKLSPKCKTCLKITKAEQKLLGADCKAC